MLKYFFYVRRRSLFPRAFFVNLPNHLNFAGVFFPAHSSYKSTMRLNITKIRPQDYGEYHCVSKNEMGIARAVFHLQGNDFSNFLFFIISKSDKNQFVVFTERNPYIIRGLPDSSNPVVFGARPPEKESYEDICGPPQTCPECPDPK